MTDLTGPQDEPAGAVVDLDAHRTARAGVHLGKEATTPAPEPPADTAREVLEGTIVPAGQDTQPGGEPRGQLAPRAPGWARSRQALRGVRTVVTHERTRTVGRFVVRHGSYVAAGGGIAVKRAWDSRTTARYERMMRNAETAGDHESALHWEQRAAAFRQQRHQRRMDLITAPVRIGKNVVAGAAIAEGTALAIGISLAATEHKFGDLFAPTMTLFEAVRWAVTFVAIVWGPVTAFAPWLALLGLWNIGRRRHAAPRWALPAQVRNADGEPITPSIVVKALRDLGISDLRKAIDAMEDGAAGMLGPIVIAGCGVEVDVLLPSGVSTLQVQQRRRKLAENLTRHEHELFITIPQAARTVRLWIADPGALDEPIGPSPLVVDPELTASYKTGRAPWGQDLRGDQVAISLFQRHLLITGLSNQGKTASLRALALWLALDPNVRFWIGDLKGIGDWEDFDGIADVLIQGPTDAHVAQVTEMVEQAVAEMERRMLAPKGTRFDPLIVIVDEAQVAFMCPAVDDQKRPFGGTKAVSRYFNAVRKLHNQGRAVDVLLWQGTQDPTDQNLPKLVREGAHIRASLVVGTESQARMALGDKAVNGGASPHLLRQGIDKGTVVVAGDGVKLEPGQSSITVRTHYINDEEATEIAARVKALRSGVATRTAAEEDGEDIDPPADIFAVLGEEQRVRTQEVLGRLAARNPRAYRGWTFTDLKRVLEPLGAAPYKSDGQMVVSRDRLRAGLDNRPADSAAEGAGDAADPAVGD